jgi:hypothetical protein
VGGVAWGPSVDLPTFNRSKVTTMRRKAILILICLNCLLFSAILTKPVWSQIFPRGLWDCCEQQVDGDPYCCESCCWFLPNCDESSDCLDPDK